MFTCPSGRVPWLKLEVESLTIGDRRILANESQVEQLEKHVKAICRTFDVRLCSVERQLESMQLRYEYIATEQSAKEYYGTERKAEQVRVNDIQTDCLRGQ